MGEGVGGMSVVRGLPSPWTVPEYGMCFEAEKGQSTAEMRQMLRENYTSCKEGMPDLPPAEFIRSWRDGELFYAWYAAEGYTPKDPL